MRRFNQNTLCHMVGLSESFKNRMKKCCLSFTFAQKLSFSLN